MATSGRIQTLLAILLLASCVAFGQQQRARLLPPTDYAVQYLGLKEGLPDRGVLAICHDHEGFVWLGTKAGLFRFDGFEFLPIELPVPPGATEKKPIVETSEIREDAAHRLWICTKLGVFMLPPDRNRPVFVHPGTFRHIFPESKGVLLSNERQLFRLRLPLPAEGQAVLEETHFSRNTGWASTFSGNDGSYFLIANTDTVLQIRNDTILRRCAGLQYGLSVRKANLPGSEMFVRARDDNYVFRFDVQSGRFEELPPYPFGSEAPGTPHYFLHRARRFAEENPNQVPAEVSRWLISGANCWEADANDNVWLGTIYGIFVFTPKRAQFEHLPFLRRMSTRAIFQEGNTVYISGSGLFCGELGSETAKIYPFEASRRLLPLNDTELLAIGEYDGYKVFNKKTGKTQALYLEIQQHCHSLLRLRNGDIWSRRQSGSLYQLFADKSRPKRIADTGLSGHCLAMVEDLRGQIWMPSNFDLTKIERSADGQYLRHSKMMNGSFSDALLLGDALWLGTQGTGLLCFDVKNERLLASFTVADGLPNDFINCLLPDGSGNIWLSTNAGLSCFDPQKRVFTNFSRNDGLEMDEYNMSSAWRDATTGRLFFGGLNGVTHFDPAAIRKSLAAPAVLFSKIVRMSEDAGALLSILPPNDTLPTLELAPGDRYLEFHLASDDPAAAAETKFFYLLENFDRDWVPTGKTNIARFALLPPGDYIFRAKCVSRKGISSPERAARIHVEQVFYKKWWFVLAVLAAVGGLIWVEWRRRLTHLRNIYHVRKRIADDLHDDVASSLNYLSMVTKSLHEKAKTFIAQRAEAEPESHEIVGRLAQIEGLSDALIGKITDIVWAIDQRGQRLGDLVERMQDYGEDLLLQNNVPIEFDIKIERPEKALSLAVRQHVLLIFKEAVNNVVRHTQSREVKIRIENRADQLRIQVENHFTETRRPQFSTGKGLESMKKRAENLLGRLKIAQGEGLFRVDLWVPKIFD